MRIAALYDIHGNLPALEAVLRDVGAAGPDLVVVGGDVMPGPMPAECLAMLRGLPIAARFIRGNGDRAVLAERSGAPDPAVPPAYREVMAWNAAQLGDTDAALVAGWPETVTVERGHAGRVLFCHATPRSDTEVFTRLTPDAHLQGVFDGVSAALVVCGHTHMPFDRRVGALRVVNAGSVGMPFGDPVASWLLLDADIRPMRTEYDLGAAAARVRATGYPQRQAFAESSILSPPSEQAMLEAYGRAPSPA